MAFFLQPGSPEAVPGQVSPPPAQGCKQKLNEKWLVLTGFSILGGEGMPPPVVSVMRQGAVQHEAVPPNIVMIEHDFPPAIVHGAMLRVLLFSLCVSFESIKERWNLL